MTGNFNLRKFLTENRLTKNTQLLKETYQPKSKLEQVIQAVWAEKDLSKAKQIVIDLIEPSRIKSKDQILSTIATIHSKPRLDQYLANSLLKFEKLGLTENKFRKTTQLLKENTQFPDDIIWTGEDALTAPEGTFNRHGQEASELEGYNVELYGYSPSTGKVYDGITDGSYGETDYDNAEVVGEMNPRYAEDYLNSLKKDRPDLFNERSEKGKKPVIKETKLTAKERKLVAIVENALGIQREEKPLPKYENIEKLMQEIEGGTNEAAHSYKMKRMKEIAEMLETKISTLEEGEGADFVDAKKVKQMKRDVMTLRKQAEKLEKEYDKKFAKKEPKKEEK